MERMEKPAKINDQQKEIILKYLISGSVFQPETKRESIK